MATSFDAQIAALNEAIAAGVRSVTIQGETTTLNPVAGLIAARDDLVRQKAAAEAAAGTSKARPVRLLHYAGRGYD
jgi:hypothetical protein